jgi:hypothetical protein
LTHGARSQLCSGNGTNCGNTRVSEFMESARRLGVDGVQTNNHFGPNNAQEGITDNDGDKYLLCVSGYSDPQDRCAEAGYGPIAAGGGCPSASSPNRGVTARVNFWKSHNFVWLGLRGTAGTDDRLCHPDHLAVAKALLASNVPDVKLYQVYRVEDTNRHTTAAAVHEPLIQPSYNYCAGKQNALAAYAFTRPSTYGLFDTADCDCARAMNPNASCQQYAAQPSRTPEEYCSHPCSCTPRSCWAGSCDWQNDGCGGLIWCGECCFPYGCAWDSCGYQDDGCGNTIWCGECSCEPSGCPWGSCGYQDDGCGNTIWCGECSSCEPTAIYCWSDSDCCPGTNCCNGSCGEWPSC